MNKLYGHVFLSGVLFHLFPAAHPQRIVYGHLGESVTLPCRYDARYYGALHFCWGRGYVPNRGCNNEVLASDGRAVTYRKSLRYALQGALSAGDVSLTISQAVPSDAGIYGCRVQIPGLFNDQKEALHLILTAAPTTTQVPATTQGQTTENPTTVPATTTPIPVTSVEPSTKSPTQVPATTTSIPVTSVEPSTKSPTQASTTTQAPVTTERQTTENPATALKTDEPTSYWPTDEDTTETLATNTPTQGDEHHVIASSPSGQTTKNSSPVTEKALTASPYLLWSLVPALILGAVSVTVIILQIRKQRKVGSFEVPQEMNSTTHLSTFDPGSELDSGQVEMTDVVQVEGGENAERCP